MSGFILLKPWQELKIELLTHDSKILTIDTGLRVEVIKCTALLQYQHNRKAQSIWKTLCEFADNDGFLNRENGLSRHDNNMKNSVNYALKSFFHRRDEPIVATKNPNGYKALFNIFWNEDYLSRMKRLQA